MGFFSFRLPSFQFPTFGMFFGPAKSKIVPSAPNRTNTRPPPISRTPPYSNEPNDPTKSDHNSGDPNAPDTDPNVIKEENKNPYYFNLLKTYKASPPNPSSANPSPANDVNNSVIIGDPRAPRKGGAKFRTRHKGSRRKGSRRNVTRHHKRRTSRH